MVSNKAKWNQTVYTKKFRLRFHLARMDNSSLFAFALPDLTGRMGIVSSGVPQLIGIAAQLLTGPVLCPISGAVDDEERTVRCDLLLRPVRHCECERDRLTAVFRVGVVLPIDHDFLQKGDQLLRIRDRNGLIRWG